MRGELVDDKDPWCIRITSHRFFDVFNKIHFGSCSPDRGCHDLARDDIKVGDQAQGAVADVFELDTLNEPGRVGLVS